MCIKTSAIRQAYEVSVTGDALVRGTEAPICCPDSFSKKAGSLSGTRLHDVTERLLSLVKPTDYHSFLVFHVGSSESALGKYWDLPSSISGKIPFKKIFAYISLGWRTKWPGVKWTLHTWTLTPLWQPCFSSQKWPSQEGKHWRGDPRNMVYICEVLVCLVPSIRDIISQSVISSLRQQPPRLPSSHPVCSAGLWRLVWQCQKKSTSLVLIQQTRTGKTEGSRVRKYIAVVIVIQGTSA